MVRMVRIVLGTLIVVAAALSTWLYSGLYDVGADSPHTGVMESLLEAARDRSIAIRSDDIEVPDLSGRERILEGASHYDAMCTGCHLKPGSGDTELRAGLYPTPPDLTTSDDRDPARDFWIIEHGIKMSGMPAWGATHGDGSIWGLVAFVQELSSLNAQDYQALVAEASERVGHDHGEHDHGKGDSAADGTEASPGASAGGHHHAAPETPEAVLDAFHHALAEGDRSTALRYLAEDVSILEGGHNQTKAEYASGHLGSDMAFLSEMSEERIARETHEVGQSVTVVTQTRLHGRFRDQDVDIISSETAILEQREGAWRIVHIHWSS